MKTHRLNTSAKLIRVGATKEGETHFHLTLSDFPDTINLHMVEEDPVTFTLSLTQLRPFIQLCVERKSRIYLYFEKGRPIKFEAIDRDHLTFTLILDSEVTGLDPLGELANMENDTEPSESERQRGSNELANRSGQFQTNGPRGSSDQGYGESTENNRASPSTRMPPNTAPQARSSQEMDNNQGSPEQLRYMNDSQSEQERQSTPASLNRSRPPIQQQMVNLFDASSNQSASSSSLSAPAPEVGSPNDSHPQADDPLMSSDDSEVEDIDPNFVGPSQRSRLLPSPSTVASHYTMGDHESPLINSSFESNEIMADDTLNSEDEDDFWLAP